MVSRPIANPQEIAEAGQKIYDDRYKAEYEKKYPGQFVAIDILTGTATVAPEPEQAIDQARKAVSHGYFHLIRIGAPGAFKVSYSCARWMMQTV